MVTVPNRQINQRREQKYNIFITDVTNSKFWLQVVTIFGHIVAYLFNFATLWHFNAILWLSAKV